MIREMGRTQYCEKSDVKRGPWTAEEDAKLLAYTSLHGTKNWTCVPKKAGLKRCGKSCRLRWTNYLRPNLKHESFTPQEEEQIVTLHATIGSRWSLIAQQLPGRTDNDVKNYWNTKLSKKLLKGGIDPVTHRPLSDLIRTIGRLQSSTGATTPTQYHPRDAQISSFNRDLKSVLQYNNNPTLDLFYQPTVAQLPKDEASSSSMVATLLPPVVPIDFSWSGFLAEDAFVDCDLGVDVVKEGEGGRVKSEEVISEDLGFSCGDSGSSSFVDEILDHDRMMMSELSEFLDGSFGFL